LFRFLPHIENPAAFKNELHTTTFPLIDLLDRVSITVKPLEGGNWYLLPGGVEFRIQITPCKLDIFIILDQISVTIKPTGYSPMIQKEER
jgi:hypothetical protein